MKLYQFLFIILFVLSAPKTYVDAAMLITNISDNRSNYNGNTIPLYNKFEITFQINGLTAQNMQMPYDPSPPEGILDPTTHVPYPRYQGASVAAIFISPTGAEYEQPAFYYQDFQSEIKPDQFGADKEWFYPTKNYSWKVRFAPNQTGTWNYKLKAIDRGGSVQTPVLQQFTVTPSTNHGFITVSSDPRYFEFSDGTYFPGLGYNMNYDQIDWINPVLNNQAIFAKMNQNGIQLIRMWLSQWAIFGSSWNPWYSIKNDYDNQLPRAGLITNGSASTQIQPSSTLALAYSESNSTQNNGNWFDACRMIGGYQAQSSVKPNTNYHIKIRYKGLNITGPRNPTFPNYGLVVKIQNPNDGNWHTQCYNSGEPQNGIKITPYGGNTNDWAYLDGQWNSGSNNFLPMLYLALENVKPITPDNYQIQIDTVFMGEDLGGGNYGANIITKPSMEHLTYYMERNAFAFDKVLDLAKNNNIYLRPVILEKNELIQNEIGSTGEKVEFDNKNFYGNWRDSSAVRWLQKAWWRYLQARWGYSPNIHSWETTNEADPGNWNHYYQTDELGKFMHCTVFGQPVGTGDGQKCTFTHPNSHMVSTSFWTSFPSDDFWGNTNYPNVDFADVHQYISKSSDLAHFNDTALSTFDMSMQFGAKRSNVKKPVIRGETGLTNSGTEPGTLDLQSDTQGIWLHNFIWGQINSGGVMESYWYTNYQWGDVLYGHLYNSNFDHRSKFKNYYNFIHTIPLNNGNYIDIAATKNASNLRIWGQKDTQNNRAHAWIAHSAHTWKNVVSNTSISPITDTIKITGFTPNTSLIVQWWNTYSGTISSTTSGLTNSLGELSLSISNLTTDIAVKIGDYTQQDSWNISAWRTNYTKQISGSSNGDFDLNNYVDGKDFVLWLNNYVR